MDYAHPRDNLKLGVILLVMAVVLGACNPTKDKLLGKWREVGKSEVLEFFDDGRVSASDGALSMAGTWAILDDGRVKVEFSAFGFTQAFTGSIEGNILTLRNDRYEKVP